MGSRSFALRAPLLALTLLSAGATASCATDFDTTRQTSTQKTTLGEEMYTALCDRVGASSLSEDHTGASFRSICHKGPKGWTGTKVDTRALPRATGSLAEPRRLAIAKVEAMAASRDDLIEAFDSMFPDKKIPDPLYPDDAKKQVRLHDALDNLTKRMTPLYESSPYSTKERKEPALMPATTQAIGALMATLSENREAQEAFARISGREGYRPLDRALGAVRTLLAYPDLRRFTRLLLDRTGPGGALEGKFQHTLRVVEQELRTLEADPKQAPLTVDDARIQPSRARLKLEILSAALLSEDDVYARGASTRFLAARDLRGFVIPRGAAPGKAGSVPAPFADKNGDGYADVDLLGRFVNADGEPLLAPPPFETPGTLFGDDFTFDASRRATYNGQLLYAYVDTSRTLLHSVMDDLRPLAASDGAAPSTLMKALEGSFVLYGPRKKASFSYENKEAKVAVPYEGFDASGSPLVDIAHASGQFLGAPESDDYLGMLLALHEKHPEKTARALQLAWGIWNKSKDPEYAQAILADTSTFWEDMTDWLAKVARVGPQFYTGKGAPAAGGLLGDVTLALAAPAAVKYLPDAFGPPMRHTDRIGYHPNNINGPPINKNQALPIKDGASAFSTKVNRSAPDQGDNRSAFQRFAHIIAAANHVNSCNKPGALVKSTLKVCGLSLDLTYPLKLNPFGDQPTIDECDLLQINDLGVFFVDSSLAFDHPRRAKLIIKDSTLTGLLKVVDDIVPDFCGKLGIDKVLQGSTGVQGLSTTPTPQALMRLVFFGAQGKAVPQGALDPLIGSANADLNLFISNTLDPIGTSACPQNAKNVNVCDDYSKTLRGVEPDTFFVAETPYLAQRSPEAKAECLTHCVGASGDAKELCEAECNGPSSGFFEGIRPTLTAFANYSYAPGPGEVCPKDSQGRCVGEQLFLDLMVILDRHWSSSGSSLFRYEDFLAWTFSQESDLFGTVSDLVTTLETFDYTSPRVKNGQKRSPLEITSSLVSFLFDPEVSAGLGITDRAGGKSTTTNDGKVKPQLTPYDLFVSSLRGFDKRFDSLGDADKKGRWRSARSSLVDQFLLAQNGAWKNPAIARSLPVVGRLLREQLNANCADRETSKQCDWARKEMTSKLSKVIEGPLFGAVNDLNEALRADEELRVELEKLINYLLQAASDPDSFALTLTSLSDLLQVLHDDAELAPILRALSTVATPGVIDEDGELVPTEKPGTVSLTLKYMKALMDEPEGASPEEADKKMIDRYHVLDHVLPLLVTPPAEGKRTPLEVILDTISAIQRIDSSQPGAFSADDYKAATNGLKTFLIDDYRGLEQFYTIVRGRNGN